MTTLEQLKQKIQKAVPKIMELKQGCHLVLKKPYTRKVGLGTRYYHKAIINRIIHRESNGVHDILFQIVSSENEHGMDVIPSCFVENLYEEQVFKKFKILGRPIRLSDVLRAMSQSGVMTENSIKLLNLVEERGKIIDVRWNFANDDLDHQSPECIEWLNNVL